MGSFFDLGSSKLRFGNGGSGGGDSGPFVNKELGVYSQISVYSTNVPATRAAMISPTVLNTTMTATDSNPNAWIQVDYGESVRMDVIKVRSPNGTLEGGWGTTDYLRSSQVQLSDDLVEWAVVGILTIPNEAISAPNAVTLAMLQAGQFCELVLPRNTRARAVRIVRNGYIAVTGFYADML